MDDQCPHKRQNICDLNSNKCCYCLDSRTKYPLSKMRYSKLRTSLIENFGDTLILLDKNQDGKTRNFCWSTYCPKCQFYWTNKALENRKLFIYYKTKDGFWTSISFFQVLPDEDIANATVRLQNEIPKAIIIGNSITNFSYSVSSY